MGLEIGGYEERPDWPKMGPSLLIATCLILAIRTAKRPAQIFNRLHDAIAAFERSANFWSSLLCTLCILESSYFSNISTACATVIFIGTWRKSLCSTCSFLPIDLKKITLPLISVSTTAVFHSLPGTGFLVVENLLPARIVANRPKPMFTSSGSRPSSLCNRATPGSTSIEPVILCNTRSSIDCGA